MNDLATLIDAARVAASHAHAPYPRFAVGAALRLTDGSIVTGANFENASYGLSLCAVPAAPPCANAPGRLDDDVEIAVVGRALGEDAAPGEAPTRPCGPRRTTPHTPPPLGRRHAPPLYPA